MIVVPQYVTDFIDRLKQPALRVEKEHGIPAAIIISKSALETGWGRLVPKDKYSGEYSYNLFGIKWHQSKDHEYVIIDTHEYIDGKLELVKDVKFRKYNSYQESIEDHTRFLQENKRYNNLWNISDPKEFARELQRVGYATDIEYAGKLISIMKTRGLLELDPELHLEVKDIGGDAEMETIREFTLSVLWGFVNKWLKQIAIDASQSLWDGLWDEILLPAIAEAQQMWVTDGHGKDKKKFVLDRLMEFVEDKADFGWVRRTTIRLVFSLLINSIIDAIKKQLGEDWQASAKEVKALIAGRVPFLD